MGTLYVLEIFMPSEKRILSPAFHDDYFVPPLGFLPAAAPTRKTPVRNLRHVLVWHRIRFIRSFVMCRLLLGRFTTLKSSLHNIQFLVLLIYSNKASIIVKQKEPIMPIQAT